MVNIIITLEKTRFTLSFRLVLLEYIIFLISLKQRLFMSEKKHQHGMMDITEQKESFNRFIKFGLYLSYTAIGALIFLALFNS